MLQSFREHIKGWVAGVIFVIISLTFLLWGVQFYMQSRASADTVAATVNGQEIKLSHVNQVFQQYQAKSGFVESKEERQQIKEAILDRLINEEMFSQGAKSVGVVGDPIQLNMAVLYSAFATPSEIKSAEQSIIKHSHFGYIQIPLSRFIGKVQVTDDQVKQYYNQNKNEFMTPKSLKVEYLEVSPKKIRQSIKISDERAQEYYQANVQQYTKPKSWLVERVVVPLKEGATPAEIAIQKALLQSELKKSHDLYSVVKDHPKWTLTHQAIAPVELQGDLISVLSSLRLNEVSTIVVTQQGVNVFKLLKYDPSTVRPFSQVKKSIIKMLLSQAVSERLNNVNQTLSDLTFTHPETLAPASKRFQLPVQVSDWVSFDQGQGIFSSRTVRALAFSDDVLVQGNNSKVISLKNGNSLVLRVKKTEPSQLKSLKLVRDSIVDKLKQQKAKKLAGEDAVAIQKMLKSGEKGEKVAKHFSLQWKQYQNKGDNNLVLLQLGLSDLYNLPATDFDKIKSPDPSSPPPAVLKAIFQSPVTEVPSLGFSELESGDLVITKLLPSNSESLKTSLQSQREKLIFYIEDLNASRYFQMMTKTMFKSEKVKRHPKVLSNVI